MILVLYRGGLAKMITVLQLGGFPFSVMGQDILRFFTSKKINIPPEDVVQNHHHGRDQK